MKVLFVSSGNAKTHNRISSIVYNQGISLEQQGVNVDYYGIKGKGIKGYMKNILIIRNKIRKNKYSVIHAHFYFSGYAVTIASIGLNVPIIVSLMGPNSDTLTGKISRIIQKIYNAFSWKKVIVKSEEIKEQLGDKKAIVIPNGVDLEHFKLGDQEEYKDKVGFDLNKKQIIWVSNPERIEKNFSLAKQAFELANIKNAELKVINGVPHEKIREYMIAADMLLHSSDIEGSPNVIKEAMAVNLPIVTTNVGDVKSVINETEGCFIVASNANEMAKAITECLKFGKRTQGRDSIKHLDSKNIAKKIIKIYENVHLN